MSFAPSLLSAEQQGDLVISVLNMLPHPLDLAESKGEWLTCCPDCCGPCGVLRELRDSDDLDQAVRNSRLFGVDWSWWDTANAEVNRPWLAEVWKICENAVPGHPDGKGGVHPARDE